MGSFSSRIFGTAGSASHSYYNPDIQRRVAERYAAVTGEVAATRVAKEKEAALACVRPDVTRLSVRVVEKTIREHVLVKLPTRESIAAGTPVNISLDVAGAVTAECERLKTLLGDGDLEAIVARYPLRETPALAAIAKQLGFQARAQYENAVRTLLAADENARAAVKALFGTLGDDIAAG
jgi:hypothetical protein